MKKIDGTNLSMVYHLSTEGYYFTYEAAWHDGAITAKLFDESTGKQIHVCYVWRVGGDRDRSHHDVINFFEAWITLNHKQQH